MDLEARKLDALIAEKVMGWKDISFIETTYGGHWSVLGDPPFDPGVGWTGHRKKLLIPNYSTCFKSAIEVRNQIVTDDPVIAGALAYNIVREVKKHHPGLNDILAILFFEPIHICRAALTTVGIESKSNDSTSEESKSPPQVDR